MLDRAQAGVAEAEARRYEALSSAVHALNTEASRIYRILTNNSGDLLLSLSESRLLAFRLGVTLNVRPPNQNGAWMEYARLSGGQQSLASMALVLGFHSAFPSPLLLMDEVEGALDAGYAQRVADVLRSGEAFGVSAGADASSSWSEHFTACDLNRNCAQLSSNLPKHPPQLIVVTLRRSMYLHAPLIVGCFQCRGKTRTLCVSFEREENTDEQSEQESYSSNVLLRTSTSLTSSISISSS